MGVLYDLGHQNLVVGRINGVFLLLNCIGFVEARKTDRINEVVEAGRINEVVPF